MNIHEAAAKNDKCAGGSLIRDDKSEMLVIYRGTRRGSGVDPACRLSITEYVGNTLLLEPRPGRGGH